MTRLTLLSILILYPLISMGCECANRPGSNFLNQLKHFDLIVLGTFRGNNLSDKLNFEIEKIYKGNTDVMTIELLPGGTDCGDPFWFKDGQRLLLGLNQSPYSGRSNAFVGRGCVTSSLFVTDASVSTGDREHSLPAFRTQRIGILSKRMKLKALERSIKRRI